MAPPFFVDSATAARTMARPPAAMWIPRSTVRRGSQPAWRRARLVATKGGIARSNGAQVYRDGLHLPEEVHVAAAHGEHLVAALEVDLGGLVVVPLHVADRAQGPHDRALHLVELLCMELREHLLDRCPYHRLGGLRAVAPGDERVLRVRAQVVHVVDRDESHGLSRLRPDPAQRLVLAAALERGE